MFTFSQIALISALIEDSWILTSTWLSVCWFEELHMKKIQSHTKTKLEKRVGYLEPFQVIVDIILDTTSTLDKW